MRAAALIALLLTPISSFAVTRARLLMGTVCEIDAKDEQDIDAAFAECDRIEAMLSTWRSDSELARLNGGRPMKVSPELMELIYDVLKYRDYTGGAFDPLVGPLVDLWQIRGRGAVPSQAEIAAALKRVHAANPALGSHDIVQVLEGARFEEGGFGKGYALDRMMTKLKGDALINFGGQVIVRGARTITIADPEHRETPVVEFTIERGSLSTSSGSEKSFEVNGRRFSHLIDPRSGEALPPRGSASAIDDSAFRADMFSTALYVMGPDDGLRWADSHSVAALFITADKTILMSRSFRARARGFRVLDRNFKLKEP